MEVLAAELAALSPVLLADSEPIRLAAPAGVEASLKYWQGAFYLILVNCRDVDQQVRLSLPPRIGSARSDVPLEAGAAGGAPPRYRVGPVTGRGLPFKTQGHLINGKSKYIWMRFFLRTDRENRKLIGVLRVERMDLPHLTPREGYYG